MTTAKNNEHKKLNFSNEQEQSQACLNSAEHEKNQGRKVLNVPNLRFPEFQGEWTTSLLSDYLTENKERNKKGEFDKTDVLSVSGDYGIVNQIELLGRSFAGASVLPYHVVRHGNIVYTKSPLKEYPYGIVKANTGVDGIVSTLYAVYNIKNNVDAQFIEYYFSSANRTNRYFKPIVRIGAKHDMKIGNQEVLANKVTFPNLEEQTKIASLFRFLDERIATQNKIIDKLQSLIKGLNDLLYTQYGGEVLTSFAELGTSYSGLSGKSAQDFGSGKPFITYLNVYSNNVIKENDFQYVAIKDDEKQNVVKYGDVLFTLSSETPEEVGVGSVYLGKEKVYLNSFCFGIHITNTEVAFPPYLSYYVSLTAFRKFIYPYAQGSTRFNLCKADFEKASIKLPTLADQKRIYSVLGHIDCKIETERQMLNLYNSQKQYLLRQMFI